VEWLRKWE